MEINEKIKELQAEFQEDGLKLYLQGEGEAPSGREMDKFLSTPTKEYPVGSEEILASLRDALNQKRSVMLFRAGNKWKLIIEKKKKEGCFIATACYGSYDAPEVFTLRTYRDEVLLKNKLGRALVKFYYLLSPPIARFIEKRETLKELVKIYIIDPIVNMVGQRSDVRGD